MEEKIILLLTNSREIAVDQVSEYLTEFNQKFIRINTDTLVKDESFVTLSFKEGIFSGHFVVDGLKIRFEKIKSVWYRRTRYNQNSGFDCFDFAEKEIRSCFWSLCTNLKTFWVNDPLVVAHLLEHNKLYQMRIASEVGLLVPETLISNDVADLIDFCRQLGGSVAIKPIHSQIIQTKEGINFGMFTRVVSLKQIIENKADFLLSPVMVQSYIPKKIELRVTIVGENIFTCAIHSQNSEKTKYDWRRYDFENVKHEEYQLPVNVRGKILAFMKKCRLNFGAIDMILTPDNEYVFLEVNPSGQFGWIEKLTGMPIAKSIAELLANPPS